MAVSLNFRTAIPPSPAALLELTHPITWFPPMWAFACGAVSAGAGMSDDWALLLVGLFLVGPVVCGMSQAANDWCDRHVDAINEPERPVPSGRVPGAWALGVALAMSALALAIGMFLGPWGFAATCAGVFAAWAYSAEPLRFKRSPWAGPGLVALCYEGLPWFTGAAVFSVAMPSAPIVTVAALYALGAYGIMTLNDFKALEGDRRTGIRSLPVILGPERAALVACGVMASAQVAVVFLLWIWGQGLQAAVVGVLLLIQLLAMRVLLRDPQGKAPWYNGTGVLLYVSGMMVAAFALRAMGGGG